MDIGEIIGAKPGLFLDRLKGGILWLTQEMPHQTTGPAPMSMEAAILFWNRNKKMSGRIARFGLN